MFKKNSPIGKTLRIVIMALVVILFLNLLNRNSSIHFLDWPDLPFSMHLSTEDVVLLKGEEFKLYVNGINKRVSFSSTNFRVAGVNINGKIKAHRSGKAFIIAKVGNRKLKCRVRVIEINKEKLSLKVGDSYSLKINGMFCIPSWKSNNPKVASVNIFGRVKAKGKGRTVITARVKGRELKCTVLVK